MSTIEKECQEIVKKIDFNQLKNKSILVTGASGLVGIYLVNCLRLLKEKLNISITCWIKNEIEPEFINLFNDCEIIKSDITEQKSFLNLPGYDFIIHCAGYGQPNKFMDNKIKTITLNTTSTVNLFQILNPNGKFLFMSTSELYSGINNESITEDEIGTTNTDHPRSCYIEGKRCGESICHSYKSNGVNVKIARLSLAYGPGTKRNDQRVLNSLIEKGLTKENIELLDGGGAIRTYCYITDVINMLWNIFLFGKKVTYNVGGVSKTTILELAKIIGDELGKEIIVPTEKKELLGNPKVVNISIESYLLEFGPHQFVPLKKGINNTINWQKFIYEKNYV